MNPYKNLYYRIASMLPAKLLQNVAPAGPLFPYHHLVSDADVLHVKHLYTYKNTRQFESDIDHLLKHLRPISAEQLQTSIREKRGLPKQSFLLTFDDGFREVYDIIAPMLLRKGVPAIFFINPAFINNNELFYRCKISLVIEAVLQNHQDKTMLRKCCEILTIEPTDQTNELVSAIKRITNLNKELLDQLAVTLSISFDDYLKKERPFMTADQVAELHAKGFDIGAHSWDHPYYPLISAEEQIRQTLRSMSYVKEQFGQTLQTFSFPHSDKEIPQSFFNALRDQSPIDLLFGIQNQKVETLNSIFHRFNAERPELPMNKQLNGVLLLMILQSFLNKDKVVRN